MEYKVGILTKRNTFICVRFIKAETEADAINKYRKLEHESGNNWDDVIPVIKT